MSIKLNWEMDEDDKQPGEVKERQLPFSSIITIITLLLLALVAFGIWQVGQNEAEKTEEDLRQQVQAALDRERQALLNNDGELFQTYYEIEPETLSALLQPDNIAVLRANPTVSRVEQHGNDIYTNIEWTADGETWQRITFYQWQNGQLRHVLKVPVYWGQVVHTHHDWGDLFLHEQDQEWTNTVSEFVAAEVRTICQTQKSPRCNGRQQHLSLTLAADYAPSAAQNQVRIPSPRLLALDESGQPGQPFWDDLRLALTDTFAPVTVQYAVTEEYAPIYRIAANTFAAENPGIIIDIIPITEELADPLAWVIESGLDGAALTPDERALAGGWVYDLTDYVETDGGFDQADFYEQIWRGAFWQDRMWFMPERASMQLLYYDKITYRDSGLPEPSLRWTWDEMAQDLKALKIPEHRVHLGASWDFLDVTTDALYSYAYNWQNNCVREAAVQCNQPLQNTQITAALEWYQAMLNQPEVMPDLTVLSPSERQRMMVNWRSVVWAESPVRYEFRLLIDPIGVVPFPGSDRFDGITPLTVNGSFINSSSDTPRATWEWLKFLSYQNINRQLRLIPARPSVASQNAFWIILPQPLSNAMRTAFPFSRAIAIDEQTLFNWEQLSAVASGTLTPQEAAHIRPRTPWFSVIE